VSAGLQWPLGARGKAGSPDSVKQGPRSSASSSVSSVTAAMQDGLSLKDVNIKNRDSTDSDKASSPTQHAPVASSVSPPQQAQQAAAPRKSSGSIVPKRAPGAPAWGGAGQIATKKIVSNSTAAAPSAASKRTTSRSRAGRSSGRSGSSSDGEARYYQVMFKKPRQEIFVGYDDRFKVGDYVKVEADRGEDLGKLVAIWSATKFNEWLKSRSDSGSSSSNRSVSKFHKRMLRLATQDELDLLVQKNDDEETALALCRDKATARKLPMTLVGAEYQFDRHKLTFFFEADRRIDFRELVRDLFSVYKTRIWLQQLSQVNRGMPLEKH
jgi:hypothetical protein